MREVQVDSVFTIGIVALGGKLRKGEGDWTRLFEGRHGDRVVYSVTIDLLCRVWNE
jgi:hypothetical protein